MGEFEDKPTNGYRQDKRLIEFRLESIEEKQTALEDNQRKMMESQQRQEVALAELKTEFRWRAGIFGVVGAALVVLGKLAVEKLFGG